jgi:uncharacterized protein YecE (DUF72 family)
MSDRRAPRTRSPESRRPRVEAVTGRLYVGTSGFAYPAWAPRFYPPGLRAADLLPAYAARLPAVEINNTFYRQPRPELVASWLAATPNSFRFVVKAQRGGTMRSFADPVAGLEWLTGPYRAFGQRLGAVLFRIPDNLGRDDARLARFLAAWPADLPLVVEARDPSWQADETIRALTDHGAALCVTEAPEDEAPPTIRRTAPRLYLRLRRHDYSPEELRAWLARLEPFLAAGDDAFVFFRHDEVGRGGELAVAFLELAGVAATP